MKKIIDNKTKSKNCNFIGGIHTGRNITYPKDGTFIEYTKRGKNPDKNYIRLENPNDLVIVDRDYMIENYKQILAWCNHDLPWDSMIVDNTFLTPKIKVPKLSKGNKEKKKK